MPEPAPRIPIAASPLSVLLLHTSDAALREVLPGWLAALDALGREYEVFVADATGSGQVPGVADQPELHLARVRVLSEIPGAGPGAALRAGLAAARHPLFLYVEATSSYQADDLARLMELIDRVDLVSGQRVPESRRDRLSWNAHAYRWLVRLGFGVRLKDVDSPFKLFRREIFARIPIQSDGELVHAEIIAKANFLGYLMTEVPVRYRAPGGAAAPRPILRTRWREGVRLFRHPDFGPAVLSVPGEPASVPTSDLPEVPLAGGARHGPAEPVVLEEGTPPVPGGPVPGADPDHSSV
jgi:hypothetical protein